MKLRVPWVTLSLAAVAGLLFLVPGAAPALQFEHTAVAHGELWRGLTGHLVHFNADHLMWDVFALLLLGAWAECVSRRGMVVTTLLSAVTISAMVFFLQPHLATYRGLSGLDSAMIGLTIAELIRSARRERDAWTAAVAGISALLFLGKSLYECTSGGTLFTQASGDFVAVPAAHLVGFLCGLVASGATRRQRAGLNDCLEGGARPPGGLGRARHPSTCPEVRFHQTDHYLTCSSPGSDRL